MKKYFAILVLLGFLLPLSACSEDISVNNTLESDEPIIEQVDPKQAMKEYSLTMIPLNDDLIADLANFKEIIQIGGDTPAIIGTSEYRNAIQAVSNDMLITIYEIQAVDVGNDEFVNEVHDIVLDALDSFEYVALNYPKAVKNLDLDLLDQCLEEMVKGANLFTDASNLLNDNK